MARLCASVVLAAVFVASAASSACTGAVADSGGGATKAVPDQKLESTVVTASQRSAYAYGEAVIIEPNDAHAESCTGVLVAPRVVVTAAHCIVFVPSRSWKVTAPFASGGAEMHAAVDGEPMDAAFRNIGIADYAQHEVADVGALYLDAPFANVTMPMLTPSAFPAASTSPPTFVSAVGRSSAGAQGGLALSAVVILDTPPTSRARIEYETGHVGAPGESGGPLFAEGTHHLVGVYAHAGASGKTDAWTRLDGRIYTWLTEKVASHGGWSNDSTR